MSLPLFFCDCPLADFLEIQIDEETARHVVQVLRMKPGAQLQLTDGKGKLATTTITRVEKKKCFVRVEEIFSQQPKQVKLHLCVAFTKNTSRNEWLLEKATELGASSIIPIIATRTEREKIRYDRWTNILIAALIQSQQYYLPYLSEALSLKNILQRFNKTEQKLIAHCIHGEVRFPLSKSMKEKKETIILIGPEGDFTLDEVTMCKENDFINVNMGSQRLRTETAAVAACAYFNLINYEV